MLTGFIRKTRELIWYLRYPPAKWFCSFMRWRGYAVMFYPDHFGHQAGDVEYDLRTNKKKLFYIASTIPNRALWRMHKRRVTIVEVPVWLWRYFIEAHLVYECMDLPLWRQLKFYDDKQTWAGKPQLEFSEEEKTYCDSILAALGLEKGKYVAFHARDPNYASLHHPEVIANRRSNRMVGAEIMTEEHPFQKHRNVEFPSYFPTIKWLEAVGLKAVRLGSDVEAGYEHPNLVDYAWNRPSYANPELLDLYLMAHARLYVGHATGVSHLSAVWNTPSVAVNWFPHLPGSRPTPNFIACRVKKLKVLGEILSEFRSRHFFELANWEQVYGASREIETIPNTEQEILETVKKALEPSVAHAA